MICKECGTLLYRGEAVECTGCGRSWRQEEVYSPGELDLLEGKGILSAWYRLILDEKHPYGKLRQMIDLVRVMLIALAGGLISVYLKNEEADGGIDFLIGRKIPKPADSVWINLNGKIIKYFDKSGIEPGDDVRRMVEFYKAVELKIPKGEQFRLLKGYYDDDGKWIETPSQQPLFSALLSFRNEFIHGFNPSEAGCLKDFALYYPVLVKLLDRWRDAGLNELTAAEFGPLVGEEDGGCRVYNNCGETMTFFSPSGTVGEKEIDDFIVRRQE